MTIRSFAPAALAAVIGIAACTSGDGPPARQAASGAAASEPALEAALALDIRNAGMPVAGLLTAGQPTGEQLDGLAEAGFTRFISLRPSGESGAGWEEAHAIDHPHDFDRLPISGASSLTRENVEALAALLDEANGEPTVLYCASGNRVGAMLALKAFWIDGAGAEEALDLGLSAGLTGLEGPVREKLGL